MNTRDPFECDEYPEKECPKCRTIGEYDVVCRECGRQVCMASGCFDKDEWVPVEHNEGDLCHECNGTKPIDFDR